MNNRLNIDIKSFRCPKCGGKYFGSISQGGKLTNVVNCHDQFNAGCEWSGNREEGGLDRVREANR